MIKPGQRWYSKTETELGLGIVLKLEDRLVQIYYPEKDETRIYNPKSSPLQRFRLNIGDEVVHENNQSFIVREISEIDNLFIYHTDEGEIVEGQINAKINLTNPEDKLFNNLLDEPAEYEFRYQSLMSQRKIDQLNYRGFYSSKVGIIPHQMSILNTLVQDDIKKFILCDEVGLGKTIESLNYLKHLIELDLIKSALILTPQSLQYQWFIEIFRKYNLYFKTFGLSDMVELESEFDNDNYIISSPSHLKTNQKDREYIANKRFDLIIIDEAHQINFKEDELISNKIKNSHYSMLLSATPEALGKDAFQSMQNIIDNDLYFRNRREVLEKSYSLFPKKNLVLIPINEKINSDSAALKAKTEQILKHLDQDKTLIITHSKEQARKIKRTIEEVSNIKIALFHSEMQLMERDRQVAYFQDPEGANLLICTEIGSEGRNFEFAKKLILMDLALNPTHLIQRIGRLDRIGQKNDFDIILPYIQNSFEENLLNFYQNIDIFQTYPKGISLYYERIKNEFDEALKNNDHQKITLLAKNYEMFRDDQNSQYSDVDEYSYQEQKFLELEKELKNIDINTYGMLNKFCDLINLEFEDLNEQVFSIRATQNMSFTLPGLSFDGKMYTQNRDLALVRDDIALFSFEDPLFRNIIDLSLQTDFGNCTCVKSQYKGIEVIYKAEVDNTNINLKKYFPLIPIRIFLDFQGQDITKKFPKKLIDETYEKLSQDEKEMLEANLPKDNILELIKKTKVLADQKLSMYLKKELEKISNPNLKESIKENLKIQSDMVRLII